MPVSDVGMTTCRICGKNQVRARGLCTAHYMQEWRAAQPPRPAPVLPRCDVCKAQLRPYGARKVDWPRTKGKASSNPPLCTAHQYGKSNASLDFAGHTVAKIPVEEARIVRRLIRDRFDDPDDRNLMISMVIGDDIE